MDWKIGDRCLFEIRSLGQWFRGTVSGAETRDGKLPIAPDPDQGLGGFKLGVYWRAPESLRPLQAPAPEPAEGPAQEARRHLRAALEAIERMPTSEDRVRAHYRATLALVSVERTMPRPTKVTFEPAEGDDRG
jgi:hypothetical protein